MVARDLEERGLTVRHIRLRELPADCLMSLDYENEVIASAVEAVASADGVVIATPTFKASFSGLTKLFLDILPQFGFADKAILPLATGGTLAHVLALDYGLRPVVQSMGARWVVPSFSLPRTLSSRETTAHPLRRSSATASTVSSAPSSTR